MNTKRIDELRGIACLLVLVFHAVASEPQLRGTLLAYSVESLRFIRMPIFIAISGVLYGLSRNQRPLTWGGWRKRVARLAPPFLLLTIIVKLLDVIGGNGFDILSALLFGAWHLWYLLALAVILIVIVVLEKVVPLSTGRLWMAAIFAALLASTGALSHVSFAAVNNAACLLPFFLAGAAIGSSPNNEVPTVGKVVIYGVGFLALMMHQLSLHGIGDKWESGALVASCLGLAGFMLTGALCPESKQLRCVGIHSLPIFLWHLPVYAVASGLVLHRYHVEPHLAFCVKVMLGVAVPILFANVIERWLPRMASSVGARNARKRLCDMSPVQAAESKDFSPAGVAA